MSVYRSGGLRQQSGSSGDSEVPNDKTLSDILDAVIENMPYNDRSAPDVNVLMDLESNPQIRSDYAVSFKIKKKMNTCVCLIKNQNYTLFIHIYFVLGC